MPKGWFHFGKEIFWSTKSGLGDQMLRLFVWSLRLIIHNSLEISDPISLVGCMYKIVSKILSIRLKKVINKVTESTSFFILFLLERELSCLSENYLAWANYAEFFCINLLYLLNSKPTFHSIDKFINLHITLTIPAHNYTNTLFESLS